MKKELKGFIRILTNVFSAIILCVGFYNIFINLFHQSYINNRIVVSKLDKDYVEYKNNLTQIENNLKKYKSIATKDYDAVTMNKLYGSTKSCLNILKSANSPFGLKENERLTPFRIYQLNANFSNETINHCWIMGMSFINLEKHNYNGYFKEVFPNYDKIVDVLVENADYIDDDLLDNSSYHYSTTSTKNTVRNELLEQYKMILYDYNNFSNIILEISEFLIKGEYK